MSTLVYRATRERLSASEFAYFYRTAAVNYGCVLLPDLRGRNREAAYPQKGL